MPFMIEKRSCSLSTNLNRNFYDMIKFRLLMINKVNILPYMNLNSKTSWKFCWQITKTKLKFRGKWASSSFNYKKRWVLLTVHILFEHYFWQNWLKFYDKMDLSIRMTVIYNVKNRYAIRLKLEDKFNFSNQVSAQSKTQYLFYN